MAPSKPPVARRAVTEVVKRINLAMQRGKSRQPPGNNGPGQDMAFPVLIKPLNTVASIFLNILL